MKVVYFIYVLLWEMLLDESLAWRSFKVQFKNISVETSPDYGSIYAEIKEHGDETVIDGRLTLTQDIPSVFLYVSLHLISNTEDKHAVFENTMNACKLFKSKTGYKFPRLIFTELSKHGLALNSCPFKKGNYFIREFKLDEDLLPPYLPETDFVFHAMVLATAKAEKTPAVDVIVNGRIDKTNGFNNLQLFTMDN